MIALVRKLILSSMRSGLIFQVSSSESTKTGVAPVYLTALAEPDGQIHKKGSTPEIVGQMQDRLTHLEENYRRLQERFSELKV